MATKLISSKANSIVFRTQNLKSMLYCLRAFSSQNNDHCKKSEDISKPDISTDPAIEQSTSSALDRSNEDTEMEMTLQYITSDFNVEEPWLNIKAGIFGPDDSRLPLPGNIGMGLGTLTENFDVLKIKFVDIPKPTATGHIDLLENQHLEGVNQSVREEMRRVIRESTDLECVIQECPKLIKKDLASLFPETNFTKQNVTVVTLCEKTVNDMSGWSEKVETEREELISHFVQVANKICEILIAEGYWADFIDPTSGRPYLGPFTNSTLFETDERYKHLGFVIDDLGCCKVITHSQWGPHIFVGAIFTNANVDCDILIDSLVSHATKASCIN